MMKTPQQQKDWRRRNPSKARGYNRTLRSRYAHLRAKARGRGVELKLSFDEYALIVADAKCAYCSGPLSETGHGLDRLDNLKEYEKDNVAPCCYGCNFRKGHLEGAGFRFPRTIELMKELRDSKP